jgi:sulfite exporter TauE/SafE
MSTVIVAAAATGLVGTLHCATMCGPLAVAGSVGGRGPAYLAGRLASYAAIGALCGLIGEHALCRLPVETVNLAAVVLVALFAGWKAFRALVPPRQAPPGGAPVRLGKRRVPLLARLLAHAPRRGFGLGLATGILPCGMLIPAWTLAMGAGDAAGGAAVMAAFWLGSAPGLLLPMLAGGVARRWAARLSPRVQAVAWATFAVCIAIRPLLGAVHHH